MSAIEIVFRHLAGGPVASGHIADARWHVEAYDSDVDPGFPVGMATVLHGDVATIVVYLIVADHYRRQGVGTAICDAICKRWPDAMLTSGITESGEAFLSSRPDAGGDA